MKKYILTLLITLMSTQLFANELIKIHPYKTNEFSPSLNQKFDINFELLDHASVSIDIYTPDNNLIQTIKKDNIKKGIHKISWNGKDTNNNIVPNEAYSLVVKVHSDTKAQTFDYRYTGGEILQELNRNVTKDGDITYHLPVAARVLIRGGVKNTSMIKELLHWRPKNKGLNRFKWNLKDDDKVVDARNLNFAVSVSAYSLPEYSIIVQNNKTITYKEYFQKNNLTCPSLELLQSKFKTKKIISPAKYTCIATSRSPKLFVDLQNVSTNKNNLPVLKNDKYQKIIVNMNPEDEKYFSQFKYEMSFFVDFEFVSEAELGYIPLTFKYLPNGLKPGRHILSVNVSSFNGMVAVKHIEFFVDKKYFKKNKYIVLIEIILKFY